VEWRGEEDGIMGGLGCAVGIGVEPSSWHHHHLAASLEAMAVTRSGFPSSSSYSYSNFTTTNGPISVRKSLCSMRSESTYENKQFWSKMKS